MPLHILHVSSEVYPFSKTGGLADVLGALPLEQARLGHTVTVISPWYGELGGGSEPHRVAIVSVPGMFGEVEIGRLYQNGVTYLFVRMAGFESKQLYGFKNDVERFIFFAKAVPFAIAAMGLQPQILHAHDWATGLLPALIKFTPVPTTFQRVKMVYSIHNLQYQGRWNPWDVLSWTGLPSSLVHSEGLEFFGDVNMMKAGIVYADAVTTVSPTYAQEITTLAYGEKLEGVLKQVQRDGRLHGIINGIDLERWDPITDPRAGFSDWHGKQAARARMQTELKLDPQRPTVALVTRFAQQKGIDIAIEALGDLLECWNVVILGDGDLFSEKVLGLISRYAPHFVFYKGYNEDLAHQVYAGADAFLMPSRFEPCGLSQMISMRYGTLPIARDTGGLHDTISPEIGFLFPEASAPSLLEATDQAYGVWQDPTAWQKRVHAAMALDWSWQSSASKYLELYQGLLA